MESSSTIKTLIIDDSKRSVKNLSALVNNHFPELKIVDIKDNLADGVKLLSTFHPELIIINSILCGVGTKSILKKIFGFQVPVIFLSDDQNYAQVAIKYSPLDYIINPVSYDDLKQAILKMKNKHVYQLNNFKFIDHEI